MTRIHFLLSQTKNVTNVREHIVDFSRDVYVAHFRFTRRTITNNKSQFYLSNFPFSTYFTHPRKSKT